MIVVSITYQGRRKASHHGGIALCSSTTWTSIVVARAQRCSLALAPFSFRVKNEKLVLSTEESVQFK